jgi:uncharacterized protein
MNNGMHGGEYAIHKLLAVPEDVTRSMPWSLDHLESAERQFFSSLSFFAIGTLDADRRPWASILVGEKPGFVASPSETSLTVDSEIPEFDPLSANLEDGHRENDHMLFAGLGIDMAQRWRSKVSGVIARNPEKAAEPARTPLRLWVTESLGNCPKYINARVISYRRRIPLLSHRRLAGDSVTLDPASRDHVLRSDVMFIATRHLRAPGTAGGDPVSSMDLNHRGGQAGFVRCNDDGTDLYFPDYSGNRIYSTLGNILTDRAAGIAFPSFLNGDILHVTGIADVLSGREADRLMPRVKVLVRVHITGYVFVRQGLNLQQTSPVQFSPYNPPLRHLREELGRMGRADEPLSKRAVLIDASRITKSVAAFRFEVEQPISFLPGQYAVLDFSGTRRVAYAHMNDANPQLVNDDFVRTLTISSSPPLREGAFSASHTIECTVRLTKQGAVSSLLHGRLGSLVRRPGSLPPLKPEPLETRLVATGGEFTCFDWQGNLLTSKMLWIAAGVGITPFMAMWEGIRLRGLSPEVRMIYCSRIDDAKLARTFAGNDGVPALSVFVSDASTGDFEAIAREYGRDGRVAWLQRRVEESDITVMENLSECTVFLCGPLRFMADMMRFLGIAGVSPTSIKVESFAY